MFLELFFVIRFYLNIFGKSDDENYSGGGTSPPSSPNGSKIQDSIYCKIFIFVHENLFASQALDLMEKLMISLLYNIRR